MWHTGFDQVWKKSGLSSTHFQPVWTWREEGPAQRVTALWTQLRLNQTPPTKPGRNTKEMNERENSLQTIVKKTHEILVWISDGSYKRRKPNPWIKTHFNSGSLDLTLKEPDLVTVPVRQTLKVPSGKATEEAQTEESAGVWGPSLGATESLTRVQRRPLSEPSRTLFNSLDWALFLDLFIRHSVRVNHSSSCCS